MSVDQKDYQLAYRRLMLVIAAAMLGWAIPYGMAYYEFDNCSQNLQARIDAHVPRRVAQDLVDRDGERLALRVGDRPPAVALRESVRRVHPVQGFVRPAIGMDGHAPVGLHHDQPGGERQVSGEAPGVIDRAAGDDQAHPRGR